MSLLIRAMADACRADPVIAGLAAGGVHDEDIRASGFETTPEAFDAYGARLAALSLVDGGTIRGVFGSPVVSDVVQVVALGPRSAQGRAGIAALLDRAHWLLHEWQDPRTGAMGFYAGRAGRLTDEFGVQDQITIRVARVPVTKRRQR